MLWPRAGAQRGFSFPCLSPGPQQKKKTPWVVFFFFALAPCRHGASPSLPFPGAGAKKKHPGWCFFFFFALAPCRRPTGLLLPLPFAGGRSKKRHTLGGVFFFCSGPVSARGFSFPCLSPGPEQKKNTLGGVFFFCSGPAERSRRPTERNKKKKHFAHPGPTAKNFLETNDPGHEQKGATTKKKTPWPVLELRGLWPGVSLTSYTKIRQVDQSWGAVFV